MPKYNGDVCLNSYSNSRTIVCYMCNVVANGTCVATYVDRRMPICKSVTTYRNMYNMHFYCGCDPYNHCNFVVLFLFPLGYVLYVLYNDVVLSNAFILMI